MAKNIRKYAGYSLFDFLLDPHFKQWVLQPNREMDKYWQEVIAENPIQYDTIQKAIKIVKNLPAKDEQIHINGKDALWEKIEQNLATKTPHRPKPKFGYFRYAAAILVLIGLSYSIWFYHKNTSLVYVASGNGESKSVLLPDSSRVLLGPNSSISYDKNFAKNLQREVWAEGDAKFNVKHINKNPNLIRDGERFTVHLDKKVTVEVLGTVFNISSRRGSSLVELLSGSVKVIQKQSEILLKPGESAKSGMNDDQLTVSRKPLRLIREWEQQTVLLNRTSVREIISLIRDTYGIVLKVENTTILKNEIDGVLPINDREKALQILTSITGTSLQEKDGSYLLKEIK